MTDGAGTASVTARSVTVDSLTKSFDGSVVLDGISLDVEAGEIAVLLGPSGCGKTTLLRTIAGLERPDTGTVILGDEPVADGSTFVAPERRKVGMVFQDWALFPHLTVGRNVGYGLDGRARRSGDGDQVGDALALVGLAGFEDRMPSTLSGGQQQRVALARALAPRPSVLLLDEPFSNLDTALRESVRGEVLALLIDLGITAVFVTHDQEEAFVLGDRVAVMFAGRIAQFDTPAVLYQQPVSREVAGFVGKAALVPGDGDGDAVNCVFGRVPLVRSAVGPVDAVIRPECLDLVSPDDDRDALRRPAVGQVALVEFHGHDAMVIVTLDDGSTVAVRTAPDIAVQRGDTVHLTYTGPPTVTFTRL